MSTAIMRQCTHPVQELVMKALLTHHSRVGLRAHLLVVLPAPLKQDDRSDDTDSAHEHGEHQCNCHSAQHLRIPIGCDDVQIEVCP